MRVGRQEMIVTDTAFLMSSKNTPGVVVNGTIGEESAKAMIWISEASAGMARKALKCCGFDAETRDLQELKDEPYTLRGNAVVVKVSEDPQYGIKVEIALDIEPTKAELSVANNILKGLAPGMAAPEAKDSGPF